MKGAKADHLDIAPSENQDGKFLNLSVLSITDESYVEMYNELVNSACNSEDCPLKKICNRWHENTTKYKYKNNFYQDVTRGDGCDRYEEIKK